MIYQNATAAPREELNDFVKESTTTSAMFVGEDILPQKPLRLPTGHYPKITVATGDLMRAATAARAPGAGFNRWQAAIEDGSLTLLQYPEELQIPDEQQMLYEDYFDLEATFSIEAADRVARLREILVAGQIFNTTNFAATNSGVAYTEANIATISFVADVLAAIRRVKAKGELANTIVLSGTVYDRIRRATLVQAFIAGANQPGSIVNANTLQRAFAEHGIQKVLIADSYVNQSAPGVSDVINPIWSNTYVWVGNVQKGDLRVGGVGRTFFWEKEGPLYSMFSYRDEPKKSNIIRAMGTMQCAITNTRAGTLITTQYS
jgi:hypothetical protein